MCMRILVAALGLSSWQILKRRPRNAGGTETDEEEEMGGTGTTDVMANAAGKAVADVAKQGLYAGLKFTGLALKVATGLATTIGRDAERSLSRLDAVPDIRVRALALWICAVPTALSILCKATAVSVLQHCEMCQLFLSGDN